MCVSLDTVSVDLVFLASIISIHDCGGVRRTGLQTINSPTITSATHIAVRPGVDVEHLSVLSPLKEAKRAVKKV